MQRVLISNDDGITAPGLCALARSLMHKYDVRICAPEKEQSAMSHSITVREPLYTELFEMPGDIASIKACKVSGTPADCVRIALCAPLFGDDWKPDVVLSGINRGNNVGLHVLYSGTVGAAMEAVVLGYPAMALSLNHPATYPSEKDEWPFEISATEGLPIIDFFMQKIKAKEVACGVVLNVNFPNVTDRTLIKGVRATKQGPSMFVESFEEKLISKGPKRCWVLKGEMALLDKDSTFDTHTMFDNWISVSPLSKYMMANGDEDVVTLDHIKNWSIFKSRDSKEQTA